MPHQSDVIVKKPNKKAQAWETKINQCRSNTPVNICVGSLIIKELFQISDDEMVENLMLDPNGIHGGCEQ